MRTEIEAGGADDVTTGENSSYGRLRVRDVTAGHRKWRISVCFKMTKVAKSDTESDANLYFNLHNHHINVSIQVRGCIWTLKATVIPAEDRERRKTESGGDCGGIGCVSPPGGAVVTGGCLLAVSVAFHFNL